jgi:tetratricopeptide (TPR) repeat protein
VANAEVKLPGFAFTGQEISAFSIRPSFSNISVSFDVQSSFDTYISQESFKIEAGETKDYSSEDPGGVYSGGFGTSLSSVFVGEKAYRNNIVKGYLDKKYLGVIESYNKYIKKIQGTGFEEEVKLVYAFALLETGSISKSFDILKGIAYGDGLFRKIASDRVLSYMLDNKDFESIDIFASGLSYQTPFSLYSWLYALLQLERYDRVVDIFDKNSEISSEDSRFYDFYINARYAQGGFEDVISVADKATKNTYNVVADSFLARSKVIQAEEIISQMPDNESKKTLTIKLFISRNEMTKAASLLKEVDNDEDRLNVFFFYIAKAFPDLDLAFMNTFAFDSRINGDYLKFYFGVYYLSKGMNLTAIKNLDGIIFNKDLVNQAYYYRGLAYVKLDPRRAERYFLKYIEESEDDEKITISRYMLSQLYYLKEMLDESLMLIQACEKDFCNLLRAKIYLDKKDYDKSWDNASDLQGDDAALVRATILYNRKMYKAALKQLKIMYTKNDESDYLTMLSWLKLGNTYEAGNIFKKHSSDKEFVDSYLEHLFLAGQYAEVLNLTDKRRGDFAVIRAKSLFSLGKLKMAAAEFEKIIKSNKHSFDAWYGLLTTYVAMKDNESFKKAARDISGLKKRFSKKDFLILQTSRMALDVDDTKLATVLLNSFFEQFDTSVYKQDAYLLRGKLFRDTGRVQQCLNDAEMMLNEGRSEDALFLKGECLQNSNPDEALKIFKDMADNSGRFRDLGYSKLIELYKKPSDVLKAVNYFKDKDTKRYYEGLDRYLSILSKKELKNNRNLLDQMIAERNPKGLSAAYFYIGEIMFNDKKYEEAARMYMKSHYLFPSSKYSYKSLKKTIDSYKKLGRDREVGILDKKLKAMRK